MFSFLRGKSDPALTKSLLDDKTPDATKTQQSTPKKADDAVTIKFLEARLQEAKQKKASLWTLTSQATALMSLHCNKESTTAEIEASYLKITQHKTFIEMQQKEQREAKEGGVISNFVTLHTILFETVTKQINNALFLNEEGIQSRRDVALEKFTRAQGELQTALEQLLMNTNADITYWEREIQIIMPANDARTSMTLGNG